MIRIKLYMLLLLLAQSVLFSAEATTYSRFMDAGGWRADVSVFACELSHVVPYYGEAVFATRAGESSQFRLAASSAQLAAGTAALTARSPVWLEHVKTVGLGEVSVGSGPSQIVLPSSSAELMLAQLYEGRELVFSKDRWRSSEAPELAITTVGFRAAYEQYLGCLAGLLPANFDQIKRTAVYFGSNEFEDIGSSERRKLDHIVAYVKADPSVKEFYIDGHTDSVGTRADNLELAQKRAEEVVRYLTSQGVPAEAITSRWHGERYPVVENDTGENRARNRRVTIRLERVLPPPG